MADIKINLGETVNQNPSTPPVTPAPQASSPLLNIFNQQVNKESGPKMLESITNKDAALKLKPILGNAPNLQKTLQVDKEYEMKKKLRRMQFTLVAVFVLAASSAFYFYSELTPSFSFWGENISAKLISTNESLAGLQTKLNKSRYMAAQIDLNRLSFTADEFLDKTAQLNNPNTDEAAKLELTASVETAQMELPKILQRIKENLEADLTIKTYQPSSEAVLSGDALQQKFQEDLRAALKDDRAQLTKDKNTNVNSDDIKLIDNTIKLVGNTKLLSKIKAISVDGFKKLLVDYRTEKDPAKQKYFQQLISGILDSTKNDISTIGLIKSGKIEWSKIIAEIKKVTKDQDVDPGFGDDVYDATGLEIKYSGYEFDSSSGKVVLSGFTKTKNGNNFSLISTLVDKLEESPLFKNAQMRSFSKSGSDELGYSANFKIDMELQKEIQTGSTKKLSLIDHGLERRANIKRVGQMEFIPQ